MPSLVRPRIERRTPADLVAAARAGELRVPGFQRLYRWTASDVVALFDSIYKGYPIGNLLLWQRSAPADHITLGPLEFDAPAVDRCHWVVDGQQRITSIVGALTAPEDVADPRSRIFFDLDSSEFRSVPIGADVARAWLPVRAVVTNQALLIWQRDNADWLEQRHFDLADTVARAIREYEVPSYIVESQDEQVLREIFARLNTTGRQMTEVEVFQSLWSAAGRTEPHGLRSLADTVAGWGFGRLEDEVVLASIRATRSTDPPPETPTATWREFDDPHEVAAVLLDTERAMRRAVAFIREVALIPHARLLYSSQFVIPVLTRFIHLFGYPDERVGVLLRRWLWRVRGLSLQDALSAVRSSGDGRQDALASARRLLNASPGWDARVGSLPERQSQDFGVGFPVERNVLGMLSLGPLDLVTGEPVAAARLLDLGDPLIRPIIDRDTDLRNNLIHGPTEQPLQQLLVAASEERLTSHAVTREARAQLAAGNVDAFLTDRAHALALAISWHIGRMAEWGARDDARARDLMRLGG